MERVAPPPLCTSPGSAPRAARAPRSAVFLSILRLAAAPSRSPTACPSAALSDRRRRGVAATGAAGSAAGAAGSAAGSSSAAAGSSSAAAEERSEISPILKSPPAPPFACRAPRRRRRRVAVSLVIVVASNIWREKKLRNSSERVSF